MERRSFLRGAGLLLASPFLRIPMGRDEMGVDDGHYYRWNATGASLHGGMGSAAWMANDGTVQTLCPAVADRRYVVMSAYIGLQGIYASDWGAGRVLIYFDDEDVEPIWSAPFVAGPTQNNDNIQIGPQVWPRGMYAPTGAIAICANVSFPGVGQNPPTISGGKVNARVIVEER